jgi:blue copper oxidase
MLKKLLFTGLLAMVLFHTQAQYNTLWIPDTISGTNFNLTLRDTFAQFLPGQQTITAGINGKFWGPTLFFNDGDTVQMNVTNNLNDSTTIHWHGFHLPAVMDGGPHQIIPPGTVWQPYWKVKNRAATYWYHPHLHMMAEQQMTEGMGGLIIVRDATESALALPRTYGVDDIPIILTDRRFDASNQFEVSHYGDTMMTNFTLNAQYNLPAQMVRMRVLNAATERFYNIGFSDNRSFYVITADGGLLDAPVALTRLTMGPGERVEILVDFTGQSGQSFDLKAYNSTLTNAIPGGEPVNFPVPEFQNDLGKRDFNILHINVTAQTANPITTMPATLTTNTFWPTASATVNRTLSFNAVNGPQYPPGLSLIDNTAFDINVINKTVNVGDVELWTLTNTSNVAHPFHIHDIQFYITEKNGAAAPAYEQGWKDVVWVPSGQTVKFIGKFEDYTDPVRPFMYHCHIAFHEDGGMMGQFVVTGTVGVKDETDAPFSVTLMPNPASNRLFIKTADNTEVYYVKVIDNAGRTVLMLPQPALQSGIDISALQAGMYFVQVTDMQTRYVVTERFIKQ